MVLCKEGNLWYIVEEEVPVSFKGTNQVYQEVAIGSSMEVMLIKKEDHLVNVKRYLAYEVIEDPLINGYQREKVQDW